MGPGHKPLVFDRPLRGRIYDSIAETIGNTPLVRIPHIVAEEGITADICLKLEFFNPIGSVKDRIGVSMILDLEAAGRLTPGATIIEPTSGNTGIGLAFVVRRARLQADTDDAGIGVHRAPQDAGLSRRATGIDAAREGHERCGRPGERTARRRLPAR